MHYDAVEARAAHRLNVVARKLEVTAPNQVWVSDLTYLPTLTGFVYLAVVLDLFARRVVGWSVSADLDATIAVTALRRALALRPAPAGMIHHSDRGVHYACAAYRAVLAAHGMKSSMSRKGNCWDNAVAENFFSSLKFEVEFDAKWNDVHDVERDISEYIDGFYNSQRRHLHNQYLSPVDFEPQFNNVLLHNAVSTKSGQAQITGACEGTTQAMAPARERFLRPARSTMPRGCRSGASAPPTVRHDLLDRRDRDDASDLAHQLRVHRDERVCLQLRERQVFGLVGRGPAQLICEVPCPVPQHRIAKQPDRHLPEAGEVLTRDVGCELAAMNGFVQHR
jgi:integrase-like protein